MVGAMLLLRYTVNARFFDTLETLARVQPRCRTTHAKNLRPLGSSAAGFLTLHTLLVFFL